MSIVAWGNGEVAVTSHVVDSAGSIEQFSRELFMRLPGTVCGEQIRGVVNIASNDNSYLAFLKERLEEGLTHKNLFIDMGQLESPVFEIFIFTDKGNVYHYWQGKPNNEYTNGLEPFSLQNNNSFGDGAFLARAVLSLGKGTRKAVETAIKNSTALVGDPVVYVFNDGEFLLKPKKETVK